MLIDHIALLLSALAAITIVAKIWTVAHGGAPTIAAIVSSGGLTSLMGALVAGLPAIGILCVISVAMLLPEAIREGDKLLGPLIGTVVALLIGFALAPRHWFVIGVVVLLGATVLSYALVGFRVLWGRRIEKPLPFILSKSKLPQDVGPLASLSLLGLVAWVAVAASDRPWLPAEDISTATAGVITGHVLTDSKGLVVLRDSDRSVVRLGEDEVREREICDVDSQPQRSLLSSVFWSEDPDYPSCSGK